VHGDVRTNQSIDQSIDRPTARGVREPVRSAALSLFSHPNQRYPPTQPDSTMGRQPLGETAQPQFPYSSFSFISIRSNRSSGSYYTDWKQSNQSSWIHYAAAAAATGAIVASCCHHSRCPCLAIRRLSSVGAGGCTTKGRTREVEVFMRTSRQMSIKDL